LVQAGFAATRGCARLLWAMALHQLSKVCSLSGHEDTIWSVAWRPGVERLQLATCGTDRVVRLWGLKQGVEPEAADGWVLLSETDLTERHNRTLRSLSWAPKGDMFAVASFDATVTLWKVSSAEEGNGNNFECVGTVAGHENEVKSSAFSPTGAYFATCSRDKSVWIYETDQNFEYECVALLQSHTQDVKMVRWHPTQDVLFSCSYDDTVKVWSQDGDDWACKETLTDHESTVWDMSFDPKGARFVTCSEDRTLRIWAPVVNQPPPKVSGVVSASYVSPLFRGLAGIPVSTGVGLVAPKEADCPWRCSSTIQGHHPRAIYSVDWAGYQAGGNSATLATACGDNRVRIFQPENEASLEGWACVADVEAHDGDVNCVAWCPRPIGNQDSGALLASVGDDGMLAVWCLRS